MNQGAPPPYGPYTPPPAQPGYGPQQAYGQPPPAYPPYGGYGPQFNEPMRRNDDEQHLSVLSICTFIYAGLSALGSVFGLIYVALGLFMATSVAASAGPGGPPAAIGGIMAVVGGVIAALALAFSVLLILSGLGMRKRQRRMLSFVVGCLICINLPLGTILGVFTILVLNRPSVKALYDQAAFAG